MYRGNCLRMHAYVDRDRLSLQEVLLSSSTNRTFWGNTCFRHMYDSMSIQYNVLRAMAIYLGLRCLGLDAV